LARYYLLSNGEQSGGFVGGEELLPQNKQADEVLIFEPRAGAGTEHLRGKSWGTQAAQQIGIHYSTAKTIIFFHKHHHKSYRSFKLEDTAPPVAGARATYLERPEGLLDAEHI
jgi:hypothetical protein